MNQTDTADFWSGRIRPAACHIRELCPAAGPGARTRDGRGGRRADADGQIARRADYIKVKLTDNAAARGIVKAPLTDIKDNSFIGVTGMPQSDGSQKAVEIHIFPSRCAAPARVIGRGI